VTHVEGHLKVSQRRACRVLEQHRSTQRYAAQRPDDEAALVRRMHELVRLHPRRGYRGLFPTRSAPKHIRSDNGPEFIATAIREFLVSTGVGTLYIEPGSPWQNGFSRRNRGELQQPLPR